MVQDYILKQLLEPPLPSDAKPSLGWHNLHGSCLSLAIATIARHAKQLLIVVTSSAAQLQIIKSELDFYLDYEGAPPIHIFPDWECLAYDLFSPPPDITSARLSILAQLPTLKTGIFLTTTANLMQRLPPLRFISGHSFALQQKQRIDPKTLREQLARANYTAVTQVLSPGEFCFRGHLIDIFPMGSAAPFRLDLFDDEIETIRYFDPDTQRSKHCVSEISLRPTREFPLTEDGIKHFRQAFRRHFEGDPREHIIYREISAGNIPSGTEFYMPLFFERTDTLFDFLPRANLCIVSEELSTTAEDNWNEIQERYSNANYDRERCVVSPAMMYLNPHELQARIDSSRRIIHSAKPNSNNSWNAPSIAVKEFAVAQRHAQPYHRLLDYIKNSDARILIVVETAGRREAMEKRLHESGLAATACDSFLGFINDEKIKLGVCISNLARGLSLPKHNLEIICESQLYGEQILVRRTRATAQDPEAIIHSLAELKIGDAVVHVDYGVGRYRGLCTLGGDESSEEFLLIEYKNADKLYVPILSFNLISRFVGGDSEHAPLHNLGSNKWQRAKKRARKKAYDVAAELLELESLRKAHDGQAFNITADELEIFTRRFKFTETADQARAIEQVCADLESPKPMDRLVCGDVGFGKTEVALRAAFIVTKNKAQVALLAPTTLLAHQHYQTFLDRFAQLPINVEVLSRFKTKKQTDNLITALKQGQTDIVIGTHRLLQKDVGFKNLGLLIIDEEHRFGVRQKERIKKLRSQVDLLTLTATPIPRTLNLALSGLRAISLIATPPENRLSIKTFIRESSDALIREAILREIRRGGQVYYLHNEVRSIKRAAEHLAELVPEAQITFGHGQMNELQLENVMRDFVNLRFNVLVCSTIIESGLDIPSANTIIINRADKFGLAQLHQLRGRVGRAHHQAFAYLLIPERKFITVDAKKRLNAFSLMEELGAGFNLASHDLEIRGAGELLGETQSGMINDVGFSLYSEYLSQAVKAIRTAQPHEALAAAQINLHASALLPDTYLGNPHTRLMLYKRIAAATDIIELEEIQIDTIDKFGLLPEAGKNLFRLTAIRLQAEHIGIRKIEINQHGGAIEFIDTPNIDSSVVLKLVQDQPQTYRMRSASALSLKFEMPTVNERIDFIEKLLDQLESKIIK